MNNWRLLLLAVIAVLQPIGSFTERNLIDGPRECCDHRSQETSLYGNSRKTAPDDHRISSQGNIREDRRHYDARNDQIRSREIIVERTDRRISQEPEIRFNTGIRFARDQERRQLSVDARESRQTREDLDRRTRENISRDSLRRYERDVLDSRRIRMSRDDSKVGSVSNDRIYDQSLRNARTVRDSRDFQRVPNNREIVSGMRGRNDVARDESRRDSRIGTFRTESSIRLDNNNERRNLERRVRGDTENQRSQSLETNMNSVQLENYQTLSKTNTEGIDERRQREQNRELRDRSIANLRTASERIFNNRPMSRDAIERVDRNRRNVRGYDMNEQRSIQQQHREEYTREASPERREFRLSHERSQSLSRESRVLDGNVRSERVVSYDRTDARKEMTGDNTNERRQYSRSTHMSRNNPTDLKFVRNYQTREESRQSLTRSLDRVRAAPVSKIIDQERDVRYRRDVRSEESLDERREHDAIRISKARRISLLRESRGSAERRQEVRSPPSSLRFEVTARPERESKLRERNNVRFETSRVREERRPSREPTVSRMIRETERKPDDISMSSRFAKRVSEERATGIREETNRERLDVHREAQDARIRNIVNQRATRDVSAPFRRPETRRMSLEFKTRIQRARTLEDIRDERRAVRERDENRAFRDRITMSRLSREGIDKREARETVDLRVDARNEIVISRGNRMAQRVETRRQHDESRSRNRVLQRQARDIQMARSVERRFQETGTRVVEIRSERLSRSDDRRINEREVRNIESRRESRMMHKEVQSNRPNLASERLERTASRDVRIESKLRSADIILAKDIRADTRRETRDTHYRSFEVRAREMDLVDNTAENAMSWQMVFYTLQGAYLCGLLIQMLTEKSNKGKSRNIGTWWAASKDLVKVD